MLALLLFFSPSSTGEQAFKYQIDIGGSSCTTWSALQWKMATGSLVFVVTMPGDFTNSWPVPLQPHVHYAPVATDVSQVRVPTKLHRSLLYTQTTLLILPIITILHRLGRLFLFCSPTNQAIRLGLEH